jgi:hypothetical protein
MTSWTEVDRIAPDTAYGAVFDLMRASRPFVVTGAAAGWPAINKWTPDFFIERYGSEAVEFARCGSRERVQNRLSDYFDLPARDRATWYLVDWDFRRRCPDLLFDFSIPAHFAIDWLEHVPPRQRPDLMWVYIGHAGTYGPAHVDNFGSSAWLAVVQGRKRVAFPTMRADAPSATHIDLFHDRDQDEVVAVAEAILETGDVLFVPAGRWHAAKNETYCLSVTANFIDGVNFSHHRAFSQRRWHGQKMLSDQMNRLSGAIDPAERQRLRLHIDEALSAYRDMLIEEIGFVHDLRSRLGE